MLHLRTPSQVIAMSSRTTTTTTTSTIWLWLIRSKWIMDTIIGYRCTRFVRFSRALPSAAVNRESPPSLSLFLKSREPFAVGFKKSNFMNHGKSHSARQWKHFYFQLSIWNSNVIFAAKFVTWEISEHILNKFARLCAKKASSEKWFPHPGREVQNCAEMCSPALHSGE